MGKINFGLAVSITTRITSSYMSDVPEKLTQNRPINFRPTAELVAKLEILSRRSHWTASDIIRTGLDFAWHDIEAHVLMQSGKTVPVTPAERRAIADLRKLGGDPLAALKAAAREQVISPTATAA